MSLSLSEADVLPSSPKREAILMFHSMFSEVCKRYGLKLTVVIDVSDPVACTALCLDWYGPPTEEVFYNGERG